MRVLGLREGSEGRCHALGNGDTGEELGRGSGREMGEAPGRRSAAVGPTLFFLVFVCHACFWWNS